MDSKKFEDLVDALERNMQTSATAASNAVLVKILRLMWAEIQSKSAD